jgi:hypothetical protein
MGNLGISVKAVKISIAKIAAEFAVIVLGVLVALGFESWREDVAERELEKIYLVRLASEFDADTRRIENAIKARETQQAHINLALKILDEGGTSTDEDLLSVYMASRSVWSRQIGATFRELFGTGRLQIVDDTDLRIRLVGFYSWMTVAIVDAPGLDDRMPYRDIVRGEIDPALQEAMRACGGQQARILGLPDTNMVEACDYGALEGQAAKVLSRIRAHPEALPALRRWAAAFSALESRLVESHIKISQIRNHIFEQVEKN